MIIFLRELSRNKRSFIIWTAILVVLNVMMMSFFPTMADNSKKFAELLKDYPKAMIEAFGIGKLNMGEVLGYYGMESYMFVSLLGSIFAMVLGSGILSKEESDKTIEFLYAKPVTRNEIVTSKALAVLVYVLLFNIIISVTNFILFEIFKRDTLNMTSFLLLCVGPLTIHLTFAALGFIISIFIVKAKSILPLSFGIVLAAFFINIIAGATEKAANLKYLSPFKYVEAGDLIQNHRIQGVYLVIMALVITISIFLTYIFYNRKNIVV